jgi:ATP-dependent DNA helicase DinG
MTKAAFAAARTRLPDAPALVTGVRGAVWVSEAAEAETLSLEVAERAHRGAAPIVCHARAVAPTWEQTSFMTF